MAVRLLVAEDDPMMRSLLLKILRAEGYVASGATSGGAALRMLEHRHFDLLLSDLRMSPMDGLELASASRERSPRTRIVLITAYGAEGEERRARAAGADAYLEKPFAIPHLLATVRSLVRRSDRRPRTPAPGCPL